MKSEKITAQQFVWDYIHGYALHRINREKDGKPKHFIQISVLEWYGKTEKKAWEECALESSKEFVLKNYPTATLSWGTSTEHRRGLKTLRYSVIVAGDGATCRVFSSHRNDYNTAWEAWAWAAIEVNREREEAARKIVLQKYPEAIACNYGNTGLYYVYANKSRDGIGKLINQIACGYGTMTAWENAVETIKANSSN